MKLAGSSEVAVMLVLRGKSGRLETLRVRRICNALFSSLMQKESQIFPPTTGGAQKMAADMEVPFLGKVPLDPRIGRCCDEGKSFLSEVPESPAANAYKQIIQSTFNNYFAFSLRSDLLLTYTNAQFRDFMLFCVILTLLHISF